MRSGEAPARPVQGEPDGAVPRATTPAVADSASRPAPDSTTTAPAHSTAPATAHSASQAVAGSATRSGSISLLLVAAAVVALAAWRATLGISFVDDASYVVIPLRFALGARPLADEMTVQGLGFLIAVPFVKVWHVLFGTAGIALASRLFYVALATGVGYVVYRALKPSFGAWAAAVAVIAVLLAPPYNVMAVSYNTMAVLSFTLAIALAWVAMRDEDRRAAAVAGAAAAVGAISYASLAPVAVTLALALLAVAWRRRVFVPFVVAGVCVGVVCGGALVLIATPHGVALAAHYSSGAWGRSSSLASRISSLRASVRATLVNRWLLPAWILAVAACVPRLPVRVRAGLLAVIPVVATAIPVWHHHGHRGLFFGQLGTGCLITISAVLAVPVILDAVRERGQDHYPDLWRLFALAAPPAVVGFVIVGLSTSSGWFRGLAFVGLAPFTVVLLSQWGRIVRRDGGRGWFAAGATGLIAIVVIALFSTSFKDGPPLSLSVRIAHGPLAGIATSPGRASQIAATEAQGRRWVRAGDRVLVFNSPLAYLLVGGRPFTNAVWVESGPADSRTVAYYDAQHRLPDVAFLSSGIVARSGGTALASSSDPLIRFLRERYRVAETSSLLDVYVPRSR